MLKKEFIKQQLSKGKCYKCGNGLLEANQENLNSTPTASIMHLKCKNCQANSVVTVTFTGLSVIPLITDLETKEIKRFSTKEPLENKDLINLHKKLRKKDIWNLLQIKEQN
jgi:ubiquitin C-terminal hydrolase